MSESSASRAEFFKFAVPFALLGAGVLAAGFIYYSRQLGHAREEAGRHVSAIADLKVDQLTGWREERLADARFFFANPLMGGSARQMIAAPSEAARIGVLHWINPLKENHDYSAILLLDTSGNVRLALGGEGERVENDDRDLVRRVVDSKQIVLSDLHLDDRGGDPRIDLAVPLREADSPGSRVFGVLLFRIDPSMRLFPLIQTWPTASASAETLLVRRDGDDVLFLNAPRHRPGAPLGLRRPLSDLSLPAARAAAGRTGLIEGADYRGIPVVAAARIIPGSPWVLVSKVDAAEFELPVREHAIPLFALVALLLAGMATIVVVHLRHEKTRFELRTLQEETERKALAEHFELLARYANDIILLSGPDGRITEANDRAVAAYGYPLSALRGLPLRELNAPIDAAVTLALLNAAPGASGTLFESVHRRRDGSTFPVEVSARMIDAGGKRYVQAIVRDITDRKAAERRIERLNRVLAVSSHVNQAIVRLHDRQRLFEEACRIAVDDGGLTMAWIGLTRSEDSSVAPVAIAGRDDGYVSGLRVGFAYERSGSGPVGRSVREARPVVCRDIATDPLMAPWREPALARGYRSCASFPLLVSGEVFGVAVLYAAEVDVFDAAEVDLFEEVAADLAHAIETLDTEARRIEVESALQQSERRNAAFIEHSFDIITILDADATIRFESPSIERVLGYAPEELVGASALDYVHPDDAPAVAGAIEKALAKPGGVVTVEFRFRHRDGTWRDLEATGQNLLHDRGFEGLLVNSWDVTSRKQAELGRLEIEGRYRNLVEMTHDLVWAVDTDGRITYLSPAAREIFGRSPAEMIGRPVVAFVPLDQVEATRAAFDRAMAAGDSVVGFESRVYHADGSEVVLQSRAVVVRDARGRVASTMGTSQDVTERARAEEALRLQSGAMEAAVNGVVITDLDGTIVWVNPAITRLTGYGERELIGANPRLLKSGVQDGSFYREMWTTIVSGTPWHGELTNRRRDGTFYEEEMSVTPIRNSAGAITHFVAIKQDVSLRKKSEEDLRQANARLEQALADLKAAENQVIQQERLRALGTMASGVAHDFNNALVPILGFSELLLHHPEFLKDAEKCRRYLQSMNTAANDASRIVARLREFYRHRDDGEAFTAVRLDRLVQEAVTLTQPRWSNQAMAEGVEIQVVSDLGEVPSIVANAGELREALTNLIFNAVDAMPRGGTLTLRTRDDDTRVVVEIVDTGLGMTDEVRRRCLEPFFTTKGEHGTGLGLSMVYGIVQRHDGEVEIDSRLGRGTTFRLLFPVRRKLESASPGGTTPKPAGALRILVIDDQRSVRNLLGEFLNAEGHEAAAAEDGPEGLDLFARRPFDLVIVDRAMPTLSGDDVAAAIKATAPGTPVIMLTGFGGMMDSVGEVPPGVDVLLGKPVTMLELREAIARARGRAGSTAARG